MTSEYLSQIGLIFGIAGSLLLAFSVKVGTISKGGQIIIGDLDPMEPIDKNVKKVKRSHWHNKYLTPIGWMLIALAFCLQFLATFDYFQIGAC